MASKSSKGQKKTRTGKTSTQKKKTTIQVEKKGDDLSKDIILWTVLAVSILLFVSNLGVGGVVGNAVSGFFFGVFGLTAYLFPIVLLVGTFFAISNKENTFALMKLIFSLIFLVFPVSYTHLTARNTCTPMCLIRIFARRLQKSFPLQRRSFPFYV